VPADSPERRQLIQINFVVKIILNRNIGDMPEDRPYTPRMAAGSAQSGRMRDLLVWKKNK
jgi:hypothetical protein